MGKQAAAKSTKPAVAKATTTGHTKTAAKSKSTAKSKGSPKPKATSKARSSRSTSLGGGHDVSKKQQPLSFHVAQDAHHSDGEMYSLVEANTIQTEQNQVHQSFGSSSSQCPSSGHVCSNTANDQQVPDADDTRASAQFKKIDAKTRRQRLHVLTKQLNNIEKRKRTHFRDVDNDHDVFCKEEFRSICHDQHGTSD